MMWLWHGEISSPEEICREILLHKRAVKYICVCVIYLIKNLSPFHVEPAPVLERSCLFSDDESTADLEGVQPESTCLFATATLSIFSVSNTFDSVRF